MQYYFILGKNPDLSQAELEATFELKSIKYKVKKSEGNILIIETEKELDVPWLNQRLGGMVKIGQVLDKVESLNNFEKKFCSLIECEEGKVHFGFSVYALDSGKNIKKFKQKLKSVAMEIKRKLREEKNLNSRWVVSKESELSSVVVKKNQLIKYGSEICFLFTDKEILVGQTLAVQLFEEFGDRDFNRPGRDTASGMLPPKLARIMINLAQADKDSVILDPFCGSGTVLQEALLMEYRNLTGFDNSERAISDTNKNLAWLEEKFEHLNIDNVNVKQVDVLDLENTLNKESVDFIITEPYLGPPLNGSETESQIDKNIKVLESLYLKAFKQFAQILKYKGKVVMVIPEFRIKDQVKQLNLYNIQGFKAINKKRLEYSRPNQHVLRNIMIFEKI